MLAHGAQHDDAHARVLVEALEHQAELVALRHRHHVERRPVEDDVGALARLVDLDAEAVERGEAGVGEGHWGHVVVPDRDPVMAGLDPAIHALRHVIERVSPAKTGHDVAARASAPARFLRREGCRSGSYSPATSRRRSSLPTGDFGMASTNT